MTLLTLGHDLASNPHCEDAALAGTGIAAIPMFFSNAAAAPAVRLR
jgi:hypothetical protein